MGSNASPDLIKQDEREVEDATTYLIEEMIPECSKYLDNWGKNREAAKEMQLERDLEDLVINLSYIIL